jgi:DNA-binding response OmpR family regulator
MGMSARILVVDDDPEIVNLFAYALRRAGYQVEGVLDGRAALERARQAPPDLILLDVMMPGIDGYEVARRLRAEAATAAIPIVMLTARALIADQVEGLQAGANSYLVKPVTPSVLVNRVKEILATP